MRSPSASRARVAAALLVAAHGLPLHPCDAAATPASPAPFVEAEERLGLRFVHDSGARGEFLLPEITCGAAALLDYDGDGDLDVYLAQGGPLSATRGALPGDRLFRNDLVAAAGGGVEPRFVDVTARAEIPAGGYACGLATGDYDGDGAVDLYVLEVGPNRLLRNRGDGRFADATGTAGAADPRWSVGGSFFDYDADGHLDLWIANYVDPELQRPRACRTAAGARDYCNPAAYRSQPDALLRNRGDGTFEDVSLSAGIARHPAPSLGVVTADLDEDGRTDVYVANDGEPNHLWLQTRPGWFEETAMLAGCAVNERGQPEASMGVDAEDLDGDGHLDLFLTHLTGETNTVYVHDGHGGFEDRTAESGLGPPSWHATSWGTAWIDLENDGRRDLVIANGAVRALEALERAGDPRPFHQKNQLFRNLGGGRFAEASAEGGAPFERSEVSRGIAAGDLDGDGGGDFVLVNADGPARLYLHRGRRGHFLGLRLLLGGRDALGARVRRVRPDGAPQLARVATDGGYASPRDPRVLLGLGAEPATGTLEVLWPDGARARWHGLPSDRYVTLYRAAPSPRR